MACRFDSGSRHHDTRLAFHVLTPRACNNGLLIRALKLTDFDYSLPSSLIAEHPLADRAASRLLHVEPARLVDRCFRDLVNLIAPGDALVFNDTRVLKARLIGTKDSGGKIELLVERLSADPAECLAQIRASKSPKPGATLLLGQTTTCIAIVQEREGEFYRVRFASGDAAADIERCGALPLPPYIRHTPDASDAERYQTVYARQAGAVAAPTAGLHFDEDLLAALTERKVRFAFVTLHVGAGTFQPVRVDDIRNHKMHHEWYEIPAATVQTLDAVRAAGGRIWAVGTTSLRTLEGAALHAFETGAPTGASQVAAGSRMTNLFVTPGFQFRVVDRLITNFHLPKSTLLMLVSAFAGHARMRAAYAHAVEQLYRFFSYGDAMVLERATETPPER
jgi:S-adenosylmethionine:tRNA ribosyltransferase-isomerase